MVFVVNYKPQRLHKEGPLRPHDAVGPDLAVRVLPPFVLIRSLLPLLLYLLLDFNVASFALLSFITFLRAVKDFMVSILVAHFFATYLNTDVLQIGRLWSGFSCGEENAVFVEDLNELVRVRFGLVFIRVRDVCL